MNIQYCKGLLTHISLEPETEIEAQFLLDWMEIDSNKDGTKTSIVGFPFCPQTRDVKEPETCVLLIK